MKNSLKICLALIAAALIIVGFTQCGSNAPKPLPQQAMYHWKTVFDLDSAEQAFITKHDIGRIYLHMFDVALDEDAVVPIATTKFKSTVPDSIEIVPVAYITLDALQNIKYSETEYAPLIIERMIAMCNYNNCGDIKELQFDCDWTSSTKHIYENLCSSAKEYLDSLGMELSITVRLHQLHESVPSAHRGVLMLYNTGAIKNPSTRNSILDIKHVKPYVKSVEYPIPLDYAYPAYGWGVLFDSDNFVSIVNENDTTDSPTKSIRKERPTTAEIMAVKQLVEEKLGKPDNCNIIYHLDNTQLQNYSDYEISQILSF